MNHPDGPIMFNPADKILLTWSNEKEQFVKKMDFPYDIKEMIYDKTFATIC